MTKIDSALIAEVTGLQPAPDRSYALIGLVDTSAPGTLTFLDQARFVPAVTGNANIAGAIVTAELAPMLRAERPELDLLVSEDPRWDYYSLYNHIAERDYVEEASRVAPSAKIHSSAEIAAHNVVIGENTIIGPRVVVLPDVRIGSHCVIQPGSVIGSVGFEIKRTSRGLLTVSHDGIVDIGDRVEIGANSCIDKGFRRRPTLIEDEARIDNLVHIAHAARVGRGAFVIAGTVLGGSCTVGDDVWLSINSSVAPGLSIGDGAFVSIGAVVTKPVEPGEQVSGNFAVPHRTFLKMLKNALSDAR